jgi:hypothetical protein
MNPMKNVLERAIAQQSAEWLEANCPAIFDALQQELANGKKVEDIKRTMRRTFGFEMRDAFVMRVIQTAEYLLDDGD